jgi:hypothetical protein
MIEIFSKKNGRQTFTLFILLSIGVAIWWVYARTTGNLVSPAEVAKAAVTPRPISYNATLRIEPMYVSEWPVEIPLSKTPGRLYGSWHSRGKSAGISGASDDTLIGYELRGPNNAIIATTDHPTSGNFDVRYETPGVYRFVFKNSGLIRSSAREVIINATYQQD